MLRAEVWAYLPGGVVCDYKNRTNTSSAQWNVIATIPTFCTSNIFVAGRSTYENASAGYPKFFAVAQ
jgi:hypothetical protein